MCVATIFVAVYVQSTWMRSRDAPHFPMRFQYVVDLVEEVTLCK